MEGDAETIGDAVGIKEGIAVGTLVDGLNEGEFVDGIILGALDGCKVGDTDGEPD